MAPASQLQLAASAQAPLTPEHRKFNQLVAEVEKLRAELHSWQEQLPLYAQPLARLEAQAGSALSTSSGPGRQGSIKPSWRATRSRADSNKARDTPATRCR